MEKRHPKNDANIDAEKGTKSMPEGFQNDAKMHAKIMFFHSKIDAEFDTEKVMNIYENPIRK